jgi:hypothetical protein
VPVVTKIGLRTRVFSTGGVAVDGLTSDPPLNIEAAIPTLIVYQQFINIQDIHFSQLSFVESLQAYQFNMNNTDRQFFSNVYEQGYYDVIQIGLWMPEIDVSARIEPVEGRPGMFKIIPDAPLQPGKYAVYFGNAIHHKGIIFAAADNRRAEAFYFAKSEKAVDSGEVLAPTCSDPAACMTMSEGLLARGQYAEAQKTWDKVLELGGRVEFLVCRETGFTGCKAGTFSMNTKELSFVDGKGQPVFSAPLSDIESKGAQRAMRDTVPFGQRPFARFKLKVSGKDFNFVFMPKGVTCTNTNPPTCDEPGPSQQEAVANYISRKLATLLAK